MENRKCFLCICFAFLESTLDFQCSEKEVTLRGQVFLKLLSLKDVLI